MGISRRVLLRQIGAAAVGAAAVPALAEPSIRPGSDRDGGDAGGNIRLDRNENAYGPSPRAIAAMQDAARTTAFRYPDDDAEVLRDAIARFHRVARDQVVVGCGSTEVLRMAADTFLGAGKRLVMARPTFEPMGDCARRTGASVVAVALTRDYAHDLDAMLARTDAATALVYICNPNNPTGTLTRRRDLDGFIRQLPETAFAVIDEAYHHYAGNSSDYASFIDQPIDHRRVIVTRTFSTTFGLAGLRVGYAIASRETARLLEAHRLQDNVNVVAARAAVAALADDEHVRLSVARTLDDRQEFINQCHARMVKPIDSAANFVMMTTGAPAPRVIEHFRKNAVLLAPPVPGFETHIRVSLGTPAEMAGFWRAWDLLPARQMTM
jgi:histidinol-phosphate aminotransferase